MVPKLRNLRWKWLCLLLLTSQGLATVRADPADVEESEEMVDVPALLAQIKTPGVTHWRQAAKPPTDLDEDAPEQLRNDAEFERRMSELVWSERSAQTKFRDERVSGTLDLRNDLKADPKNDAEGKRSGAKPGRERDRPQLGPEVGREGAEVRVQLPRTRPAASFSQAPKPDAGLAEEGTNRPSSGLVPSQHSAVVPTPGDSFSHTHNNNINGHANNNNNVNNMNSHMNNTMNNMNGHMNNNNMNNMNGHMNSNNINNINGHMNNNNVNHINDHMNNNNINNINGHMNSNNVNHINGHMHNTNVNHMNSHMNNNNINSHMNNNNMNNINNRNNRNNNNNNNNNLVSPTPTTNPPMRRTLVRTTVATSGFTPPPPTPRPPSAPGRYRNGRPTNAQRLKTGTVGVLRPGRLVGAASANNAGAQPPKAGRRGLMGQNGQQRVKDVKSVHPNGKPRPPSPVHTDLRTAHGQRTELPPPAQSQTSTPTTASTVRPALRIRRPSPTRQVIQRQTPPLQGRQPLPRRPPQPPTAARTPARTTKRADGVTAPPDAPLPASVSRAARPTPRRTLLQGPLRVGANATGRGKPSEVKTAGRKGPKTRQPPANRPRPVAAPVRGRAIAQKPTVAKAQLNETVALHAVLLPTEEQATPPPTLRPPKVRKLPLKARTMTNGSAAQAGRMDNLGPATMTRTNGTTRTVVATSTAPPANGSAEAAEAAPLRKANRAESDGSAADAEPAERGSAGGGAEGFLTVVTVPVQLVASRAPPTTTSAPRNAAADLVPLVERAEPHALGQSVRPGQRLDLSLDAEEEELDRQLRRANVLREQRDRADARQPRKSSGVLGNRLAGLASAEQQQPEDLPPTYCHVDEDCASDKFGRTVCERYGARENTGACRFAWPCATSLECPTCCRLWNPDSQQRHCGYNLLTMYCGFNQTAFNDVTCPPGSQCQESAHVLRTCRVVLDEHNIDAFLSCDSGPKVFTKTSSGHH